jgi:hypothetical protein
MYSSDKNYGMWLSIFDSANNLFSDYSRYIHPWKIYLHPPWLSLAKRCHSSLPGRSIEYLFQRVPDTLNTTYAFQYVRPHRRYAVLSSVDLGFRHASGFMATRTSHMRWWVCLYSVPSHSACLSLRSEQRYNPVESELQKRPNPRTESPSPFEDNHLGILTWHVFPSERQTT